MPEPVDGVVDERDKVWDLAVARGFHDAELGAERLLSLGRSAAADGQRSYALYQSEVLPGSLDRADPVATYASFDGTVNAGAEPIPVDMITAVSVRPSHRRRGLLSAMITADLQDAKQRGVPLAALTASEATIYGRFGFGEANRFRAVTVDTREGFALRRPVTGPVELIPTRSAAQLQADLFDDFHRQSFGSISRPHQYRSMVSGQGDFGNPEPDRKLRAAAHYAEDGQIDGYVSYKHLGHQSKPPALEVLDLLALNDNAYLALWKFLGEIDLSGEVNISGAPLNDPLLWALTDSRRYRVTREVDSLWLRPLDVPALLRARKFSAAGELRLGVVDRLGLADGSFALSVDGGTATVETLPAGQQVELELDVAALGSLYLGAVSARTLQQAGRIPVSADPAAVERFDQLFATAVPPVSRSSF